MDDLAARRCEACRVGAPKVTPEEIGRLLPGIPGWTIDRVDGIDRLTRSFAFKNFREALAFADRVGAVAEEADHHPLLTVEWGRVTVAWWTHKIGGLHVNDFIMAARTDRIEI
jgi:4a-hydroxytetrahydrobiopterin dehydratase